MTSPRTLQPTLDRTRPLPRTDANTGRVQLFACCVSFRATCGPERLLGPSLSGTDSAAEMGRCYCFTIVITNIMSGVGGAFLCFGSFLSDAGVKPRREAKVRLQLSIVSARSDHAVPLHCCATRASTTTCTECVCEREPRVLLFGAGKVLYK